jgi:cobalamin biosynthesis protein CobT
MWRDRKDQEARRAAVLFGEFCHHQKIPFEILSFTTRGFELCYKRFQEASPEDQKKYTRWGDLKITVYKEFHEQWKRVGHRLSNLKADSHNYDGEAVKVATQRLLLARKNNERLILFVFSDGMPEQAIESCQPHHQWYLKKVVKESQALGVECVGIGICTDSVKKYYPNWIVIDDPTKLAATQLEKLKEVLSFMKKSIRRKIEDAS